MRSRSGCGVRCMGGSSVRFWDTARPWLGVCEEPVGAVIVQQARQFRVTGNFGCSLRETRVGRLLGVGLCGYRGARRIAKRAKDRWRYLIRRPCRCVSTGGEEYIERVEWAAHRRRRFLARRYVRQSSCVVGLRRELRRSVDSPTPGKRRGNTLHFAGAAAVARERPVGQASRPGRHNDTLAIAGASEPCVSTEVAVRAPHTGRR